MDAGPQGVTARAEGAGGGHSEGPGAPAPVVKEPAILSRRLGANGSEDLTASQGLGPKADPEFRRAQRDGWG